MKKIIAAAAGLMLTATMISTASAAVEFSGDARARYYYQDYDFGKKGTGMTDKWRNRVRLKMKGTTEGGSYAVMHFYANNNTWDGTGADVSVEYAYLVVPMGCVEFSAGRMALGFTTGFMNDFDTDAAVIKYANEGTTLTAAYNITENNIFDATDPNPKHRSIDEENRIYVVSWGQEWNSDWTTTLAIAGVHNELGGGNSGAMASFEAKGNVAGWKLGFELGYQEDGVAGSDEADYEDGPAFTSERTGDDGWGAYISAGTDFTDQFGATFLAGFAIDGYKWDAPVGFIMLGGDNMITPTQTNNLGDLEGDATDTFFFGVKTAYQATETLSFGFNLAYANMEESDEFGRSSNEDFDAFEVSASALYSINEGTALKAYVGYLNVENFGPEEDAYGLGLELALEF